MKTLTRRAAIAAAGTALVATPLLAAGAPSSDDPLTLSPRFAELFAKWKVHHDAGDHANAEIQRIEAAARAREGIAMPKTADNVPVWNIYWDRLAGFPEIDEIERLEKLAGEEWSAAWPYVHQLADLEPETLGDIVAQFEAYIGSRTPEDISERIFIDLPDNVRRVIGGAA